MNSKATPSHLTESTDILLADVAIRIQLRPTHYNMAVERYQKICKLIERGNSPLKDCVDLFYPQGSIAIGATIASKLKTDEFDIDIAAQLDLSDCVSPNEPLDLLFEAIRGEPGSRYYEMTERKPRCITVNYKDKMHLDVTPLIRREDTPERESWLFHHKPEAPSESGKAITNSYGFADWFKANTPPDQDFADIFEARASEYEQMVALAAESESVPPHEPPFQKSRALIVLQLLKRWRNVQYDERFERRPPSILLSKLIADAANHTGRLSEELLHQAQQMLSKFRHWHNADCLIQVANPVCEQDVLTDRWPETLQDQAIFISDLKNLVAQVEKLVSGCDLGETREIMVKLFGEVPTTEVFQTFNESMGNQVRTGQSKHSRDTGSLIVPATTATSATVPSSATKTKQHTFYGKER